LASPETGLAAQNVRVQQFLQLPLQMYPYRSFGFPGTDTPRAIEYDRLNERQIVDSMPASPSPRKTCGGSPSTSDNDS